MDDAKALELLFQRPLEPLFTSRDNGKAAFELPDSFYTPDFESSRVELQSRFGDNVEFKIPLRNLSKLPDLGFAKKLGKKDQFSLFQDKHLEIAGKLIKLFLDAPDVSNFISLCGYTKDRVNPVLFQYCYSVAVGHRKDTSTVSIPPIAETFPSNFVEPSVLKDARATGSLMKAGDRNHVMIPQNYTASDREDEQRLGYFREDIGVNMHHWHWHLVYPGSGPREIVAKDRRGELFYYMHHQIMARYNVERFCNNLKRVVPLNNLRETIPEGYFPKILSSVNNRTYPARLSKQNLSDLNREDNIVEIADAERWRDRIHEAIDLGYVKDAAGKQYPLDEVKGIDLLGDLIEASALSINRQYYGNLHNIGHDLIAYCHDPENRHLEQFGVMGDVTTAMRDPVFYRWHTFIDNICLKHKALLPPYDESHLGFSGISVDYIEAKVNDKNARANTLLTYLQRSDVDLAAGLDFGPNGNIYASFTHLQHADFEYTFNVTNTSGAMKRGTCRIFICPKSDERGTPLKLEETRLMAIEMDKFTVDLNPGSNTIRRRSDQSSITIPFERSFRRIGEKFTPKAADELARFRFCGCGWPQHLLLPKGREQGMAFDLFVMISDYTGDAVQQTNNSPDVCAEANSFCGLKDKLYPDKRSMGYPFDRRLPSDDLTALTSTFSNMMQTDVTIIFTNKVINKN